MRDGPPRLADAADLPQIRAVVADAYGKYLGRMDRAPAPMDRDYDEAVGQGLIWVVGDPVVGLVSLVQSDGQLLIENVAVHPSAQGSGLGHRLMDFAESEARARGLARLVLYTSEAMTENVSIYTHLGFVEIGRRTEDGFHRIYMEKVLTAS